MFYMRALSLLILMCFLGVAQAQDCKYNVSFEDTSNKKMENFDRNSAGYFLLEGHSLTAFPEVYADTSMLPEYTDLFGHQLNQNNFDCGVWTNFGKSASQEWLLCSEEIGDFYDPLIEDYAISAYQKAITWQPFVKIKDDYFQFSDEEPCFGLLDFYIQIPSTAPRITTENAAYDMTNNGYADIDAQYTGGQSPWYDEQLGEGVYNCNGIDVALYPNQYGSHSYGSTDLEPTLRRVFPTFADMLDEMQAELDMRWLAIVSDYPASQLDCNTPAQFGIRVTKRATGEIYYSPNADYPWNTTIDDLLFMSDCQGGGFLFELMYFRKETSGSVAGEIDYMQAGIPMWQKTITIHSYYYDEHEGTNCHDVDVEAIPVAEEGIMPFGLFGLSEFWYPNEYHWYFKLRSKLKSDAVPHNVKYFYLYGGDNWDGTNPELAQKIPLWDDDVIWTDSYTFENHQKERFPDLGAGYPVWIAYVDVENQSDETCYDYLYIGELPSAAPSPMSNDPHMNIDFNLGQGNNIKGHKTVNRTAKPKGSEAKHPNNHRTISFVWNESHNDAAQYINPTNLVGNRPFVAKVGDYMNIPIARHEGYNTPMYLHRGFKAPDAYEKDANGHHIIKMMRGSLDKDYGKRYFTGTYFNFEHFGVGEHFWHSSYKFFDGCVLDGITLPE